MTAIKNNPRYQIDIDVKSPQWGDTTLVLSTVERALTEGFYALDKPEPLRAEISIVLADDAFVRGLNKKWRKKDKPTNVLSFPQTEVEEFDTQNDFISLGDVILAYETIKAEAVEQDKSFDDHLKHLLVHGVLHLMHFDHESDEEAEEMEGLEIDILQSMSVKNPYEML